MKNNCNVARDLMPLVIDDVASEESKQYVNEHVAECTECAIAYGEMRVELPRISAEKERTAIEQAAKRIRNKRILRGLLGALLAIAIFIGGSFVWKEYEYRLTQDCSRTMSLDEYSARLVQTKAGHVIICINLAGREDLSCALVQHTQWAGINGNTKNVLEIEMLKTIIPQYLEGDDANVRKMLRTVFAGTVIDGEWSNKAPWNDPRFEDPRPADYAYKIWDEVALISGGERQVIYTRGDAIPYCSEEMEAYYEAYHGAQPAGKSYPEWRVDLVKLLDETPEMKAETDQEYQKLRYVCENGDLKLEALYYDVSRSPDSMHARVQTDIFSFPSGNPWFELVPKGVAVNDNTALCAQYRAVYKEQESEEGRSYSTGVSSWFGRIEDGIWLGLADDLRGEDGSLVSLPIVCIELHAGDDYVVLWQEGDELQTPAEAKAKREAAMAQYE